MKLIENIGKARDQQNTSVGSAGFGVTVHLANVVGVWKRNKDWLLDDILVPFTISRVALIQIEWFSQYFVFNPYFQIQDVVTRGWLHTPNLWLDMLARWDSGWYITIVN